MRQLAKEADVAGSVGLGLFITKNRWKPWEAGLKWRVKWIGEQPLVYICRMGKNIEVCLIEDDMIQVFLTKKFLDKIKRVGSIIDFHNGKVAYDAMKERSDNGEPLPDIILLDLNMPVWDGWDFYDAFVKLPDSGSVVTYILTSSLDHSDIRKAKELGLKDRYFSKPLGLAQLKSIIER